MRHRLSTKQELMEQLMVNFIFEYNKISNTKECGTDKDLFASCNNGYIIYHLRNIIVHEFTRCSDLEHLITSVTASDLLSLFEKKASFELEQRITCYIVERYKKYYIKKGFRLDEFSDKNGYFIFEKETSIKNVTLKLFIHENSKFYTLNISNYNFRENRNMLMNPIFKSNDYINIEIDYLNRIFYIQINSYFGYQCPTKYESIYNLNSKKLENEKLIIPRNEYGKFLENKFSINIPVDVKKDDDAEIYYKLYNTIIVPEKKRILDVLIKEGKEFLNDFLNQKTIP